MYIALRKELFAVGFVWKNADRYNVMRYTRIAVFHRTVRKVQVESFIRIARAVPCRNDAQSEFWLDVTNQIVAIESSRLVLAIGRNLSFMAEVHPSGAEERVTDDGAIHEISLDVHGTA